MIVVEGGGRYIDRELDVAGDPRPPDRGRPDDLRPAAARLSGRRGRPPVAAPTRSSSPPGASRGWAASTSSTAPIAGRPLLAWALEALAAAPRGRADRRRRRAASGSTEIARGRLAAGDGRRGGRRRRRAARSRSPPGSRPSTGSATAGRRRVVLVHDGARPLVDAGARRRASPRRPREHGAAIPVAAGRRDAQARRRRASSRDGRPRRAWPRPRRPRASGATLLRAACATLPAGAARDLHRRGRPAARPVRIAVHAIPGEPANLKVTMPDDLARGRGAARGAPAPTPVGPRARTATRSGRATPLAPRRHRRSPARRGCTATPTATWRSTPSPTRCSARPAWATSAGCFPAGDDARAASPAASCSRPSSPASPRPAGGRVGVDLTIVGARPRLGPPPRRDARRDRGAARAGRRARSASRPRPATSPGDGAPAAAIARRGDRDASAVAAPADDAPAPRHARRARPDRSSRSSRATSGSTRCGPTVYGPPTSATSGRFLFADLLVRYLRCRGLRGDVGHEHHRRRRQDHPRRGRGRASRSAS